MAAGWTRRAFLSSLTVFSLRAAPEKGSRLPSERFRYPDPSTELTVSRLTNPACSSYLPPQSVRALSRRGSFFVFWSDRTGSPQAYRMDLRTGQSQQLTNARDLDGASLAMLPDDRSLLYFDGLSLRHLALSNLREREIYRVPEGWGRGAGFSVSGDGSHAMLVEEKDGAHHVRLVELPTGQGRTVLESAVPVSYPVPNPRGERCFYRQGPDSLWLSDYDGRRNRRLALAPGGVGPAFWSPDGTSVLYLNFPAGQGTLNSIREADPEADTDSLVSATSQFVNFAPNGDASVFVGASRNRAAPYVLLLLRVTHRELALCEHRAGEPGRVVPIFSPDSQRVYFQSDRDGKPAIYAVSVDRLVERTGS